MKLTVITVCYNAVKTIEITIKSVIEQTYKDLEYIIIDGASVDGTTDLIFSYYKNIESNVNKFIFISEKDCGIYNAMNKGILKASGEWILFLNSGDRLYQKKTLENIFKKNKDISIYDIIYGNIVAFNKERYKVMQPNYVNTLRNNVMPFWHPSTFIKTDLHKNILYNESYKYSSDFDFFLKVKNSQVKLKYINQEISLVNVGEGASINNRYLGLIENYKIIKPYLTKKELNIHRFYLLLNLVKIHMKNLFGIKLKIKNVKK